MSVKEIRDGHVRIVEMDTKRGTVNLLSIAKNGSHPKKQFTFDAVYDWNSRQIDLYDETVQPLVNAVLEGFNCTVFAYGQTGTGKTFTMEGIRDDPEKRGIIPNAFDHIFNHINTNNSKDVKFMVRASYLEIYQEEIRDLLIKDQAKRLELKENPDVGVYVKDLATILCKDVGEIEKTMIAGNKNRSTGATDMNEHSSRSHAIFMIKVERMEIGPDKKPRYRIGKLNLVDLAGSERQAKTGAVGQRQKEGIKINLSLSALGNVISSLVDGKSSHVPYRDSKLTRLLQDSLGGNSKTVMIANVGPASYNYEETLTTLRYANRAKNIKNRPKVNEDPKDALLREFQAEIERLKQMLVEKQAKKRNSLSSTNEMEPDQETDQESVTQMVEKIKAMESKLLWGGKNIVDHTIEQERELRKKREEIAAQKRREREILQELEAKEESEAGVRETYSSLQQEVEVKRKRLKKLVNKIQSLKSEVKEIDESNATERRELEEIQLDLMRELKLKYLIVDNFIPVEEKEKFVTRIFYDEENWKLKNDSKSAGLRSLKRPISDPTLCRPTCSYSKIASTVGPAFRYKSDNILDLELILPTRRTKEYRSPTFNPRVRAALESAFSSGEEIIIDAATLER